MINRSEYDEQVTKVLDENGAFFAFSDKQFAEKSKLDVKYVSMGAGMIAPKENGQKIMQGLKEAMREHVERTLKETSKEELIDSELANYECQISGEIDDACEALERYGITREQVKDRFHFFMQDCIEKDLF